jgi:hypothetical protein
VIEIMDDLEPYPNLLGIDWAFDNNAMLNLKKRHMSLEKYTFHVIAQLDPNEGDIYNEGVHSSIIENIYTITGRREDYVNPKVDGELSWRSFRSYDTNSDNAMDIWKNKLYDVSTRRCVQITKAVCWIGLELCDLLRFDDIVPVDTFLVHIESGLVLETQRIHAMDVVVKGTPMCCWVTHHTDIKK